MTTGTFKRVALAMMAVALLGNGPAGAADGACAPTPFMACENVAGAGFFWVETSTGHLWRVDPGAMQWVDLGIPAGANPEPAGTYRPMPNRNGEGVFVLNTTTGAGWWTDGKAWKTLGVPTVLAAGAPTTSAGVHE